MDSLLIEKKKEFVSLLLDRGVMIRPENLMLLNTPELVQELIDLAKSSPIPGELLNNPEALKKYLAERSQGKTETPPDSQGSVKVVVSHKIESKKREVANFVSYFRSRYRALSRILSSRPDLSSVISISRIKGMELKERVSLIAIIQDKRETKNGNIILTLEDVTGQVTALVSKNNKELLEEAKTLVLDEVVGVTGSIGNGIIYIDSLLWPDVPFTKSLKKSPDEAYALFLSDVHVGSKYFLREKFDKFLAWLNMELPDAPYADIVPKIKYAFFVGDLVDGVGIYPDQVKEQLIPDIYKQYEECARLFSKIPKHISLIISPGNHDALRIAEPQPPLPRDLAPGLYELPNAFLVSNPALVNIHSRDGFPGFDVLIYHGYSFDYFVANVDEIRFNNGYDRPDLVMSFLLKRRHLAPSHSSTLYVPSEEDCLVIDPVPDFFVSGHIHKTAAANYRNVQMICSSCWQATTSFQEKVGHHPEPARIPMVNLKTREVKILTF